MNKDIKEILDSIKYHIEEDDYFEIEGHFLKPLLDYITNLQEERDFYRCTDSMNMESNIKLRNRIDKAIEYIEENMSYIANGKKDYIPAGEDLLDILRGEE